MFRVIFLIRVTYPVDRVTYPDKEMKRLPCEFCAPLFTAWPAGSLQKFTLPVKAAAFTRAAFIRAAFTK